MGKTYSHNPFLSDTKKEEQKAPRKNNFADQEGAKISPEQDQDVEPTIEQIREEHLRNPLIY